MAHRTVVRNEAYRAGSFNVRERHNERKNESYHNGDVELARAHLNVHYRQNFREDGLPETYEETFNRLLAERKIVKHGTKPDAKIFCEMVFDVNTAYFENAGGYDYAKTFFEEAYRLAVKEAGSEDYILSAVMHADEKNKALSEEMGRDVYHYHLHVVYVPVVEKQLFFKKNNKNPELAGKLKEVIPQISQSNKWPLRVPVERNGKTITVNSYSLLQDRFYEHMKAAGFEGFERGERGSTAEHLNVLDYKIQQDKKRLMALDTQVEKKGARLEKLAEQVAVKTKAVATVSEIDAMGKPGLLGGFSITTEEMKTLKTLAKKSVSADDKVHHAVQRRRAAERERDEAKAKLSVAIKAQPSIHEHLTRFPKFVEALRRAPGRLKAVIEDIMRQPPEQAVSMPMPERKRSAQEEML